VLATTEHGRRGERLRATLMEPASASRSASSCAPVRNKRRSTYGPGLPCDPKAIAWGEVGGVAVRAESAKSKAWHFRRNKTIADFLPIDNRLVEACAQIPWPEKNERAFYRVRPRPLFYECFRNEPRRLPPPQARPLQHVRPAAVQSGF